MSNQEACFNQLMQRDIPKLPQWLQQVRNKALVKAKNLNFPTPKNPTWAFTDLTALFQYKFSSTELNSKLMLNDIQQFLIPNVIRIVIVDGYYSPSLSELANTNNGISITPLTHITKKSIVSEYLTKPDTVEQDVFTALNSGFFNEGMIINIAQDMNITFPIHLLHITTKPETPRVIYPKNLIFMENTSKMILIEDYVGFNDGIYLLNAMTQIKLQEAAELHHIRIQREAKTAFHIGNCTVTLGQNSSYTSTSLTTGARTSRYGLNVLGQNLGVRIQLYGLTLIASRQIADTHTTIEHILPYGKSLQLHKCIIDGAAHAIFSGKVVVHKGAINTHSEQSSRNLLLSETALIDTQPQLEILNDEVNCTHGATVGQLDSDTLFFLRSRGLNEKDATGLLTYAFASEILSKVDIPELVESLTQEMFKLMPRSKL